jgi:hypothetical protein
MGEAQNLRKEFPASHSLRAPPGRSAADGSRGSAKAWAGQGPPCGGRSGTERQRAGLERERDSAWTGEPTDIQGCTDALEPARSAFRAQGLKLPAPAVEKAGPPWPAHHARSLRPNMSCSPGVLAGRTFLPWAGSMRTVVLAPRASPRRGTRAARAPAPGRSPPSPTAGGAPSAAPGPTSGRPAAPRSFRAGASSTQTCRPVRSPTSNALSSIRWGCSDSEDQTAAGAGEL